MLDIHRIAGVALLAMSLAFLSTGCEDDEVTLPGDVGNQLALDDIVGSWAVDSSSEPVFPTHVVFMEDGSWRMEGTTYGAGSFIWDGGTWIIRGNDWYDRSFSSTIAISEDEMVLNSTRWWLHAVATE